MADSKRSNRASYVTVPRSQLNKTHPADGSEQTWVIDTSGHGSALITFYGPGAGTYSIEEGPYEGAPDASFDEVASGSIVADTLEPVRLSVYGACLKVKLTSSAAIQVVAVTH